MFTIVWEVGKERVCVCFQWGDGEDLEGGERGNTLSLGRFAVASSDPGEHFRKPLPHSHYPFQYTHKGRGLSQGAKLD